MCQYYANTGVYVETRHTHVCQFVQLLDLNIKMTVKNNTSPTDKVKQQTQVHEGSKLLVTLVIMVAPPPSGDGAALP